MMAPPTPPSCCDGRVDWCKECGGRRGKPLLGVAFCAGELAAERLFRAAWEAGREPPAEFPGTLEDALRGVQVTIGAGRPRLRRWLAEHRLEYSRARWHRLHEERARWPR